jgi:hypothetical protein
MNHEEARYQTMKVERERVTRWGVEALLDVVGRSPFPGQVASHPLWRWICLYDCVEFVIDLVDAG